MGSKSLAVIVVCWFMARSSYCTSYTTLDEKFMSIDWDGKNVEGDSCGLIQDDIRSSACGTEE
jgi:hypothetical protein